MSKKCTHKLHVCFNYTQSAVDYFGMVTLAMAVRCGRLFHKHLEIDKYIQTVKRIQNKISRSKPQNLTIQHVDTSRIKELDTLVKQLEQRIKHLETTHDQRNTPITHKHEPKRKVNQKQKGILHQIFFENKQLKRSSKELSSENVS